MKPSSPRSFWCFISYRHANNKEPGRQWATWLHQQIETYEVPSDLVGSTNDRGDIIPERIFPVFRDEDELPADSDLSSPIYRALDESKFLVVLCSPQAVESTYVASEIQYFKKIGRSDRVLAALINGEPNASIDAAKLAQDPTGSRECFPIPLRHPVSPTGDILHNQRTEPVAADFRLPNGTEGWTSPEAYRQALTATSTPPAEITTFVHEYQKRCEIAKLKILAGILGVPLGTLTQRDKTYQLEKARKRAKTLRIVSSIMGTLALLALVGGIFSLLKQQEAQAEKRNAEQQRNLALQREAEALEARALAEQQRKAAETARQAEASQRKIAQTKEAEALANLATARKEQYTSGVRFANDALRSDNRDTARQTLLSLPSSEREWEWDILLELTGPPSLMFSKRHDPGRLYQGDPAVSEALTSTWRELDKELQETEDGIKITLSPDGALAAIFEPYSGRSGTRLRVIRTVAPLFEPILDLPTTNYSDIAGAAFSPDGSFIMVEGGPFNAVNPIVINPPQDPNDEPPPDTLVFVIPIPQRVALGSINDLPGTPEGISDLLSADWTTASPFDVTIRSWKSGPVVKIHRNNGEEDDSAASSPSTIQIPWSINRSKIGLVPPPPPTPQDEDSTIDPFKITKLQLPPQELAAALLILARDSSITRILSSARQVEDSILAVFNCLRAPHAAEIWDLTRQKLISELGQPVPLAEDDLSYALHFLDIGGSISSNGRHALISHIARPDNLPPPPNVEGELPNNTLGLFEVSSGKLLRLFPDLYTKDIARGAYPEFGFDHSNTKAYYSSYDGADPSNTIESIDLATGKTNSFHLRYLFWSPGGDITHTVSPGGNSLEVASVSDPSQKTTLQQFCYPGEDSAYYENPSGHDKRSGRYTIGKFLFGKNSIDPLIDLGTNGINDDLTAGAILRPDRKIDLFTSSIRTARRTADRTPLSLSERMLLDLIELSDD